MDGNDTDAGELQALRKEIEKEKQQLLAMAMERSDSLDKREIELARRESELAEREKRLEYKKQKLRDLASSLKGQSD